MKKIIGNDYISRIGYDSNKSITGNKNSSLDSNIITLLNEFPEFIAGWNFEISNVGAIGFTSGDTKIYYDILSEETTTIEDIIPDNSILSQYTYINNPFNYRIINLDNGYFIPDRKIIKGNTQYIRINADYIQTDVRRYYPKDNGWFEISSLEERITAVCFYYKQAFMLSGNVLDNALFVSNFTDPTKNFIVSPTISSSDYGFNSSGKTGYLEVR